MLLKNEYISEEVGGSKRGGPKESPKKTRVPRSRDKPIRTRAEEHKGTGGRSHEKNATGGPVVFTKHSAVS